MFLVPQVKKYACTAFDFLLGFNVNLDMKRGQEKSTTFGVDSYVQNFVSTFNLQSMEKDM